MRRILLLLPVLWLGLAGPVLAQQAPAPQPPTDTAGATATGLDLVERRGRVLLSLDLSAPVPWRVFTLDDPLRVVLDFAGLDWDGPAGPRTRPTSPASARSPPAASGRAGRRW
ncbi:MAG: hypothetical protein R3D59_17170 [Paracoccaceae bacterium]